MYVLLKFRDEGGFCETYPVAPPVVDPPSEAASFFDNQRQYGRSAARENRSDFGSNDDHFYLNVDIFNPACGSSSEIDQDPVETRRRQGN